MEATFSSESNACALTVLSAIQGGEETFTLLQLANTAETMTTQSVSPNPGTFHDWSFDDRPDDTCVTQVIAHNVTTLEPTVSSEAPTSATTPPVAAFDDTTATPTTAATPTTDAPTPTDATTRTTPLFLAIFVLIAGVVQF